MQRLVSADLVFRAGVLLGLLGVKHGCSVRNMFGWKLLVSSCRVILQRPFLLVYLVEERRGGHDGDAAECLQVR